MNPIRRAKKQFISSASTNLWFCRDAGWKEVDDLLNVRYHGMIKWDLGGKKLYLDVRDEEGNMVTFDWSENLNSEDATRYGPILGSFIYTHGGPFRASQWHQCHTIFRSIWIAACKVWGGLPCIKLHLKSKLKFPLGNNSENDCILLCSLYAVDQLPLEYKEKYSKTMKQMEIMDTWNEWGSAKIAIREHNKSETSDSEEEDEEVGVLDVVSYVCDSYTKPAVGETEASIPPLLSKETKKLISSELKDNPLKNSKRNIPKISQPILDKTEVILVKRGLEEIRIKNQ